MVFLVDKEIKVVIQTNSAEKAKSIVLKSKESGNSTNFEIIGVSNNSKFKMLYPEYKDYHFIKED